MSEGLLEFFENPSVAFCGLITLLFFAVGGYVLWHGVTGKHNKAATDNAKAAEREYELALRPWLNAIEVSDDGDFSLSYSESTLRRFFSVTRINELKQRLDERRLEVQEKSLRRRKHVLEPIIVLIHDQWLDRQAPGLPPFKLEERVDAQFRLVSLAPLQHWLEANMIEAAVVRTNAFAHALIALKEHITWEQQLRKSLADEVVGLEPVLSFQWLRHQGSDWVWEVVFWSLFGVLANGIIGLIWACRGNRYVPSEFILLFPKIVLAPLLAVVALSVWASGFSESAVSFLNLPYFCATAFFLGFLTESLYTKIRDMGNIVLGSTAKLSEQKLAEAAKNEPYRFVHPAPSPSDTPPLTNLKSLESAMLRSALAETERGVVPRLAK